LFLPIELLPSLFFERAAIFMSNRVLVHGELFKKKWEESELKQLIDKLRTHESYVFEPIRFYPDK
jgi:hypothetical protein